jgi:serine/threonine-protein kinase
MAPEQVTGADIDARTDLYAAGLIFYQLLTGVLPFNGETPLQLAQARVQDAPTPVRTRRADAPEWASQVIDIALARDPSSRFQTALQFREAIRCGLDGLPIEVPVAPSIGLAATAAPGSLRIETVSHQPAVAGPERAVLSAPAVPEPVRAHVPAGREAAPQRSLLVGASALIVAVLAAGGWFLLRSPGASPPAAPAEAVSSAPEVPASGVEAAPPEPVVPVAASTPAAAPAAPVTPAPANETPPASSSSAPAAAPATPAAVSTRPAAASTPPAVAEFRDVRGFVVNGRRGEERDAILRFADGQILLTDRRGGTTYGSLPFNQVTSAAHTRGKNPKWYPTLAGPSADVDMPGGIFRGDRHWLALQSRAGYLIVRVDDDDWNQMARAVTQYLGLTVAELPQ